MQQQIAISATNCCYNIAEVITLERLRELREQKGLNQTEVANDLHISRQSYNFYENGQREPNQEMLLKLADYYNVTTDYLLGRSDSPLGDVSDDKFPRDFLLELKDADDTTINEVWQYLHYLTLKKDGMLNGEIAKK